MHQSFRRRSAVFLCLQTLSSTCVFAAEAGSPDDAGTSSTAPNALQEIVVTAQRTTVEQAREAQMVAPNILIIQTYSEIRKLPDVSTGEALRRIPGVSLETDEGEGRYINIRGFDADLNSTTFAGLRLPPTNNASPFNGYRAVTMDSIPIGLVGALTVTKSGTPSMDPEWLGGTVEITPKTAPSDAPWFAEGAIGTGYEPLRQKPVYDVSLTTGGRWGPFSAVLTYAFNENFRGFDDVEPAVYLYSAPTPTFPYYALGDIEQRDYELNRKRHAYGIDLGFQPDDDNSYFIRAFDAGYTERYWRQMFQIQPDGTPVDLGSNGLIQDTLTGAASLQKILRDEKETSKDQVLMVGGKNGFDGILLDYRLGWTKGDWSKPYDYYSIFQYQKPAGTITYSNSGLGHTPLYTITGAAYTDPTQYQLSSFTTSSAYNFDKETSFAPNLTVPLNFGGLEQQSLKTGINLRRRHKGENLQPHTYSFPTLLLSQAGYGPNETYYAGQYQNGIDIAPGYLQSILPAPTQQPGDVLSADAQYLDARENVYAAYLQYEMALGPFSMLGGVRVEETKDTVNVNRLRTDASGNTTVTPTSAHNSYTDAFPSLQTRYEIAPTLIGRATYASTLARPGFNQFAASTTIDLGAGQISTGNPKLKPAFGNNFDLSIEKYLPQGGIASVGLFYKHIKDYIVSNNQGTAPDPATGAPLRLVTFGNASGSYAQGLELNWSSASRSFRRCSVDWEQAPT